LIGQEEERERKKEEGRAKRGRRRGSTLLSLRQADGRIKFLYESREKNSLRSVLIIPQHQLPLEHVTRQNLLKPNLSVVEPM